MTLLLQHDEFSASVAHLHTAVADIDTARAGAERSVAELLDGGWTGRAASAFGEAWSEWSAAAAALSRDLSGIAAGLAVVHAAVRAADEGSSATTTVLAGRLG